ncbi:hypothetical protein [Plebeiibacterium marinum]|uniref:Uncharacterized protein n=1 Tax=Plebeiibacterium marinum TaxID=2992111 RepID=A0AAE3MDU1_9BACT|nr:hypothetical protein [Plebeiobacterium marinum]MCW3805776.1 hypothetical protein [Plebeiobacterium marinum]
MPELITKSLENKRKSLKMNALHNPKRRELPQNAQLNRNLKSISDSYNDLNINENPLIQKFEKERMHIQQLYKDIRKGLMFLCSDNLFLSGKFMLNQLVPDDYYMWTRHIKEVIMALFLHEEVYEKLDIVGVTENVLDDILKRLNKMDDLKYQADQEKKRKSN